MGLPLIECYSKKLLVFKNQNSIKQFCFVEIFINVAISRPILDTSTIKTENVEWYSALTKGSRVIGY